jgi:single-strand DNA-binding protein
MANFNLNILILGGRLTSDIELKQTPSGVSVCTFGLAVNRKYSKEGEHQADFFNVTAWRQTAEFVSKYFRKGSSICVIGSLQNRTWTDQQGVKHYATDIVADEVKFVDSRNEAQGTETASPTNNTPEAFGVPQGAKFEPVDASDDLPF